MNVYIITCPAIVLAKSKSITKAKDYPQPRWLRFLSTGVQWHGTVSNEKEPNEVLLCHQPSTLEIIGLIMTCVSRFFSEFPW